MWEEIQLLFSFGPCNQGFTIPTVSLWSPSFHHWSCSPCCFLLISWLTAFSPSLPFCPIPPARSQFFVIYFINSALSGSPSSFSGGQQCCESGAFHFSPCLSAVLTYKAWWNKTKPADRPCWVVVWCNEIQVQIQICDGLQPSKSQGHFVF